MFLPTCKSTRTGNSTSKIMRNLASSLHIFIDEEEKFQFTDSTPTFIFHLCAKSDKIC